MSNRPWSQVVSTNRWCQDDLSVKKIKSKCHVS